MEYFSISRLGTILAPLCVNFRTDHTRLKQKTLSSWTAVQLTEWATNVAHLPLKVKCSMVQGSLRKQWSTVWIPSVVFDYLNICLNRDSKNNFLLIWNLKNITLIGFRRSQVQSVCVPIETVALNRKRKQALRGSFDASQVLLFHTSSLSTSSCRWCRWWPKKTSTTEAWRRRS